MSQPTNTEFIQKIYAAFNSGDIQTVIASVAPNAQWVDHGPVAVPYAGDFTGRITEFFKAIGESTTGGSVAIEQYIASEEKVVAIGRYRATVRSTGTKFDADVVHVFTVGDGKVTSWNGYGDTAALLAAHTGRGASA